MHTVRGTIEVLEHMPPPISAKDASDLVLRQDGDEWTLNGEVTELDLLNVVPEQWFST